MKKITLRPENNSMRVQTVNEELPRVQTQFQEATDVNNIVKAYTQNPDPSVFRGIGNYQDNTLLGTYQESLDLILEANNAFNSLPATTREYFKNDPAKLLAFMQDENNYDVGVELGLVQPDPKKSQQQKNANPNANISEKPKSDPVAEGTEKS